MSAPHILVVDDERDIRETVREILEDEGYIVSVAENGEQAGRECRLRRPDLVLLDVWMPDIDGISLLRKWSDNHGLEFPVIMISGHGTVETAVEATRLGAYDFIEKPLSLAKLLLVVKRALEAEKLRLENIGLRQHVLPLSEPVGSSKEIRALSDQIKRIAQHNAWILISGESGSGKELFARYLHACSSNADGPFVTVGVDSIAGEHAALELFGSESDGKIQYGLLEQANGGILFLNEVGDMDANVQARFLSILEKKSFIRVGGTEPVHFDVRVVAATHRNLKQEVEAGNFREDLFYKLSVVPFDIPPLREHIEDVPELLDYYVNMFSTQENLPYRTFSMSALNRLRKYNWPGNVRELKNLVQRLLILGSGDEVTLSDVDSALGARPKLTVAQIPSGFDLPLRAARKRFEKAYFEHQLQELDGNMGKVAGQAGIERTHLYRKLKELNIDVKQHSNSKQEA